MTQESPFIEWHTRPHRELVPGVTIQVVSGRNIMFSRVTIAPAAVVPLHNHPHEQFGYVMEGDVVFTIGSETKHLVPGDHYTIPGNVMHTVVAGPDGALCMDIFSPPREEYR